MPSVRAAVPKVGELVFRPQYHFPTVPAGDRAPVTMTWDKLLLLLLVSGALAAVPQDASEPEMWTLKAQKTLQQSLHRKPNTNIARNVILIIGDGMGLPTIAAARILKGQRAGGSGLDVEMNYESFPYVGLSKTYNTNKFVPDSAGTATAFLCGVKTKYEAIGVDSRIEYGKCNSTRGRELRCIADWTLAQGKSAGLVTNMRVTHATPAPLYAHSAVRWWEVDKKIPEQERGHCKDIARQLVENYPGRNLQVVLGGGRANFLPETSSDPEYPTIKGARMDGRNLVEAWLKQNEERGVSYKYVWNKEDFDSADPADVDYLLGLFEPDHMHNVIDHDKPDISDHQEPTLAEMTAKAIAVLSKNPRGYFLLVEGGLIDQHHHLGKGVKAVTEALDLENAVEVALNMTSREDTLLVVTADHSHGMALVGYPDAGTDIFGIAEVSNVDGMPYTSLLYTNGPGYNHSFPNGRQNITGVDTADPDYVQQAAIPRASVTHTGEDVAVYATGPMAHLLDGAFEQNYVAHVMAYASCVGINRAHCSSPTDPPPSGGTTLSQLSVVTIVTLAGLVLLVGGR